METNTETKPESYIDIIFEKTNLVIATAILYTLTVLIVVISAWAVDLHRFDTELTVSLYIGLRLWTVYFYLVMAVIMVTLVTIYVVRSKIPKVKKCVYVAAFLCILGCAFFPHNEERSMIISKVHLAFAYGLMSFGTASVVMLVIKAKNKAQRVFGIVATAYAAFFLTAYVILKWDYFGYTIFFWENTFIYLFLGELMVEYEESRFVEIFGKAFPFIAVAGGVIPWFLYFAAPRNGESIESLARPYWNVVGAGSVLVFICYIAFNLSFITYMLYRPLAKKHKWADIALRIVITPVVMAAVLFGGYLSIFIFAGAGY